MPNISAPGVFESGHAFALAGGTELFEFRIEAVLGHGGFGITYLATDTHLQERVALKEYLPNDLAIRTSDSTVRTKSAQDKPNFQAGLKAFLEEARLLARFRHRNIVHVRRFFEMNGTGYIVLDFEAGRTLGQRLNEGPIVDRRQRMTPLQQGSSTHKSVGTGAGLRSANLSNYRS